MRSERTLDVEEAESSADVGYATARGGPELVLGTYILRVTVW